jgi:hypothetical protein
MGHHPLQENPPFFPGIWAARIHSDEVNAAIVKALKVGSSLGN